MRKRGRTSNSARMPCPAATFASYRPVNFGLFLPTIMLLTACNQTVPAPQATPVKSSQAVMVNVAKRAQVCWFANKDKTFRPYRMATELNSFSGQPRILIVPRNKPQGLPKLVAQAQKNGGRIRFTRFGPLLNGPQGGRIANQLDRWAKGETTC